MEYLGGPFKEWTFCHDPKMNAQVQTWVAEAFHNVIETGGVEELVDVGFDDDAELSVIVTLCQWGNPTLKVPISHLADDAILHEDPMIALAIAAEFEAQAARIRASIAPRLAP